MTDLNDFPSSLFAPSAASNLSRFGATIRDGGVDIVVAAPDLSALEVCFFDSLQPDAQETRWQLHGPVEGVWHGYIPNVPVGTPYGLRAWGEWNPSRGCVANPAKLLLDPYGRAVGGKVILGSEIYPHVTDGNFYPIEPLQIDPNDSAPYTCRSIVSGDLFPVAPGPGTSWNETVIYEAHVRGLTKQLPGVPDELKGSYAGLAHPVTIKYLKDLGVTAVELLPIHAKLSEPFLQERGLVNYWGYSTLSYFAPEPSYASKKAQAAGPLAVLDEFRGMVSLLHQAGIEIILDVVYNHTCEGGSTGPSLSWRGLDNRTYYRHSPQDPSEYRDYTGCGNTVDFSQPRVVQMALDSLRYWAGNVGVDGFRFDLGVTLGRAHDDFTPEHAFLQACLADPVLRDKKLIMEPWDVGPNGWRTSDFPLPFTSWNDRYRDTMRGFWLVDAQSQARGESRGCGPFELATRLSGSQDMFGFKHTVAQRTPRCSLNFITAHDGFTLADLTCFNQKHNEANLENNNDGTSHNLSWNHGWEGRTSDPEVAHSNLGKDVKVLQELRLRRVQSSKNLLTSLLVSAGTPMLLGGDEFGRTQFGNNNAYCQDNEISWVNWDLDSVQQDFHQCVRYLLKLRRMIPAMRPENWANGEIREGDKIPDLSWYTAAGTPMQDRDWADPVNRAFQMLRSGFGTSPDLLVIFNGTLEPRDVFLPLSRGVRPFCELDKPADAGSGTSSAGAPTHSPQGTPGITGSRFGVGTGSATVVHANSLAGEPTRPSADKNPDLGLAAFERALTQGDPEYHYEMVWDSSWLLPLDDDKYKHYEPGHHAHLKPLSIRIYLGKSGS